ncbi:MAG: FHA domain-containing protein [Lysobacterales bacterium]|nr:MAG: FHA domain-containing protein [Xanthomonadales bacterium]
MRFPLLRLLLAAIAAAALNATAAGAELPSWAVPVLRLVSATHAEPTTGVVLSADGLVLVPHDFARIGDEIVVLDGGTDIIRNGRPARFERSFPELGLKVLAVDGLNRRAAPITDSPLADGSVVTLTAFPPAEDIAEGAPPVIVPATVSVPAGNAAPSISPGSALPNVTGPLLDACGNLAGFSIAEGVQEMAPSPATQYRWQPALLAVLAELGLAPTGAPCGALPANAEQIPTQAEQVPAAAAAEPEQPEVPAVIATEAAPAETPAETSPDELPFAELPPLESGPYVVDRTPILPVVPPSGPSWWWLVGALLLFIAGLGLRRLRRLRQRGWRRPPAPPDAAVDAGADSATADAGRDAGKAAPPEFAEPAQAFRLVLRGQYADGRELLAAVAVSDKAINVEIGRGATDLVIDSPAVSRRHARLNGTAQALTLIDLGSSNGTSINGVPCMEHEIMYLEPGDTVLLGDARFTVTLEFAAGGQRQP